MNVPFPRNFALVALLLVAVLFVPHQARSASDRGRTNAIEWTITETKTISEGAVRNAEEGALRSGVVIEGKAVTRTPGAVFPEGVFRATVSVFRPSDTGAGASVWRLHGTWSIVAKGADPSVLRSRYTSHALSGIMNAVVSSDPLAGPVPLKADLNLLRGGARARGGRAAAGTFIGNTNFEGVLSTPFIPAVSP